MSAPTARPNRELVFCHSCENEWYRDEHGLECPDCHSDVVEIIEAEHDPRQEMHEDDPAVANAFLNLLNNQGTDTPGNSQPGPERGGPGHPFVTREERDTPDGHHISRTIRFTSSGGASFGDRERGDPGDQSAVQSLFQSLFTQVGGMTPEQAMQRSPRPPDRASPMSPWHSSQDPTSDTPSSPSAYTRGPPPDPYTRGPPPPPDEGPQIRRHQYQVGPFNVSMTTSSHHYVNGQPVRQGGMQGMGARGDEDFHGMIQAAFAPLMPNMRPAPGSGFIYSTGGGPGGQERAADAEQGGAAFTGLTGPLALILSSLGVGGQGGRMGDLVFSDEAMDRIVTRLMEQNQQGNAPGPASSEAIEHLPRIKVSKEMLDESTGEADCAICLVNVELGEEVAELPCKHWFHFSCVHAWLAEHDTCPQCRRGITPAEGDGTRPRTTGEAPRHWQAPSPSLTRSNTAEERPGSGAMPAAGTSDAHAYGAATQEDGSRRRSRSPGRPRGGSTSGTAASLRESVSSTVRNAMRNGILGWMGRTRSSDGTDNTGEATSHAHSSGQTTTSNPSSTPGGLDNSTRIRPTAGSRNPNATASNTHQRPAEHEDLDIPDVD